MPDWMTVIKPPCGRSSKNAAIVVQTMTACARPPFQHDPLFAHHVGGLGLAHRVAPGDDGEGGDRKRGQHQRQHATQQHAGHSSGSRLR